MAEPTPVLLLHGALRSSLGMKPTARFLNQRGFEARALGYPTRRDDLDGHAARLEATLHTWLAGRELEILGLLTHSMGGLVARALLAREGVRRLAARQRLVMLAPPNRGSTLAVQNRDFVPFQWLYGRAAGELQPARAEALDPPPPSCETLILIGGTGDGRGYNPRISGDDDGVVASAETGLPGLEPEFVGGLHSTLQWRPAVLERAASFLAAGC
ncbi:hypothetical protein G6O69_26820 [Pseudenhygromyxa sp. WMMC2535]|uniref:hypothetical protein n=1 Tax=Pseudenhygromyxa sp. WMMC2535 TaxID=2712867 RepID=UPI001555703F|nr:hypothetical protein [Pseudenhygromyxa sp. WMMC2535]NVB41480.1 hypothetical protein [Pseudenhygromyxa sp. WMMC2535]